MVVVARVGFADWVGGLVRVVAGGWVGWWVGAGVWLVCDSTWVDGWLRGDGSGGWVGKLVWVCRIRLGSG